MATPSDPARAGQTNEPVSRPGTKDASTAATIGWIRVGRAFDLTRVASVARRQGVLLAGGAVGSLVAFALYVSHLLPGVGFWDTGVYQWAAATLNLTHPTGFPLYILLGHAFITLLPLGDAAFRMNLFGAVSGAAAVAALYALARGYGVGTVVAVAAALTFGLEQAFWRTAIRADPHTLHAFLALLVLGLAIRWHRHGNQRLLTWTAFIYGLGLGNHLLMALLAPALGVFVLWSDPGLLRRPLRIAKLIGACLIGTLVYLYVPITAMFKPTLTVDYSPATWDGFWHYVTGADFRSGMGFLSLGGPAQAAANFPAFLQSLGNSLSVPVASVIVLLAVAGAFLLIRRDPREFTLLALAGGLTLYAALTFNDSDIERYYFVPIALLALLAGIGGQWLLSPRTLADLWDGSVRAAPVVALAVPLSVGWFNADRVSPVSAQCYVDAVLATVKPHAMVMSWWLDSTSLFYEIDVLHRRTDVAVFNGLNEVPAKLAEVFGHRPVYLVEPSGIIDQLSSQYRMVQLNACGTPIYEVLARYPTPSG